MRKTLLSLLAVMVMTVLPMKAAIQYNLAPEGFENGAIPTGWTQENVQGTVNWAVEGGESAALTNPAGAKQGSYRIAARGTSGQVEGFKTKLISPAMNLTQAFNPQLVFSHAQVARAGYFDTLRVYYRTTAAAEWVMLEEYAAPVTAWTKETIILPSSYQQGSAYQIAFEISDHAGLGVVLDDISVFPSSQCQDAFIQNVASTSNSVTVGFGCNGSYDNFEVVISSNPITDWTSFDQSSVEFYQLTDEYEVTATGLQTNVLYYVYVRTDCSDNESGYTNWVSTTVKTTRLVNLPYEENFNTSDAFGTSTNYGMVSGWSIGNSLENVNTPYVYRGTEASTLRNYSVDSTCWLGFAAAPGTSPLALAAGEYAYAASPEINGNLADCEVSFWGTVNKFITTGNTAYGAEITVGVMTDPSDWATFVPVKTVKCDQNNQYKKFTVSLAGYTGAGKFVAFASNSAMANGFFIDNVSIYNANTVVPTDVRVYNVLPTGFDVAAQLYGADSWNLKVTTVYNRNADAIADSLCLVNQTGLTAASFKVALAEAQIAGKTVVVYVQAVKNGVASAWAFPVTLRVPTSTVVPVSLTFNTGSFETFPIRSLINEMHTSFTSTGVANLYSPVSYYTIYPQVSSSSPTLDGAHLNLNGIDNYFVLPYVESFDSLEVVFRLSAGSTSAAGQSRVALGVMTDPYDLSTFVQLAVFDGPAGSYAKCEQELNAYTGTGHYVAIRAIEPDTKNTTYGSYNCIDNLVLQRIPACREPKNISAKAGTNIATVYWETNGMSKFLVKLYSNAAHTAVIADTVKVSNAGAAADSVAFAALQPLTTYYYSVQTICGTDTLDAEDYLSFTTALGIPYSENFNNGFPTNWKRYTGLTSAEVMAGGFGSSNTSGWESQTVGSSYQATEGKCIGFNLYSTYKYWAVTPNLSLADETGAVKLNFDFAIRGYSSSTSLDEDDQIVVLISNDGGKTWPQANAHIWSVDTTVANEPISDLVFGTSSNFVVNHLTVDLSQYVGQTVMVAFGATSAASGADVYVCIDNVSIRSFDANCQGISKLSATASGANAGDIFWQVGGTQSAYINVSRASDSTVVFAGDVTTTPYHVTGLEPNTNYNVFAYQTCYPADTLRASFHTDCAAMTIEQFGTETFSATDALNCWHVGIGDTTGLNSSSAHEPYVYTVNGMGKVLYLNKQKNTTSYNYGNNYYAILPELTIDSIKKYQVVFDAATTTTRSDTANLHKLYVGVITDPNDLASFIVTDTIDLKYAKDSLSMKTYVIGFDNYDGDDYGMYGTYVMFQVSAPNGYSDIAVIDNLRLEPVAGCHQIIDMEPAGQTSSSIDFEWSGNAASYQVMLTDKICKPDTTTDYIQLTNVTNAEVTFSNLTAGTTYYAYVRGICAPGDTSTWSSFTMGKTAYGIPFAENFDGFPNGAYLNDDWKTLNASVPADSVFNTSAFPVSSSEYRMSIRSVDSRIVGMNGRAARTEVYTASYDGFLQSPAIDFTNVPEGMGINLSFRVAMTPYSTSTASLDPMTGRVLRVYVSEDGGETFNSKNVIEWNCDGTGDYDYRAFSNVAQAINVDVTAYAGKSVAFGFYSGSTVSTPDAYLYIDSVAVEYYDNSCLGVSKLRGEVDLTNAVAKWQRNSEGAVLVDLASDADFNSIIRHDSIDSDSIAYSSLAYNTTYYVRVKPACADEWVVNSFKTPFGLPFTENFNASTNRPLGWTGYSGNIMAGEQTDYSYGWSVTSSAGAGLASNHIYGYAYRYNGTSSTTLYRYTIATPEIVFNSEPGNNIVLSFKLASTSSSTATTAPAPANVVDHTFAIMLSADGGETWFTDSTLIIADSASFAAIPARATEYQFDLTPYAGQSMKVGFYHGVDSMATNTSVYLSIDDIKIESVNLNCLAPAIEGVSSTTDSITYVWEYEIGQTVDVQLSTSPTFASIVDLVTVSDSTYTFGNLAPSTAYYARVRVHCSETSISGWSDGAMFSTQCAPYALPYMEGFETMEKGNSSSEAPLCWNILNANAGEYPYVYVNNSSSYVKTGNQSLYFVSSSSKYAYAIVPEMALPTNQLRMTFDCNFESTSSSGMLYVGYMSNPADASSFVSLTEVPRSTSWQTITVEYGEIPASAAGARIAFKYGGASSNYYLGIDNISIVEIPQDETLKEVKASNLERISMDLNWTPTAKNTCNEYEVVMSTTALTDSLLATATGVLVDTTFYHAANLERGTTYYIYVRTHCPVGDGYGKWVSTKATTKALNACDNIEVGNGTSSTSVYLVYTSWGNSYTEHIYTAQELLAAGLTAGPIAGIEFNFAGTSSSYDKLQSVYMGHTTLSSFPSSSTAADFVTGLQLVYSPTERSYAPGWQAYPFAVPFEWDGVSNIVVGFLSNQPDNTTHSSSSGWSVYGTSQPSNRSIYRYRDNVAIDVTDLTSVSSGGANTYRPNAHFVQCYSLDPCPAVTAAEAELIGFGITEAKISWTASDGDYASSYDVFCSTSDSIALDSIQPQFTGIDSLSVNLTGLSESTTYYVYIRTNCQANGHDEGSSTWFMTSFTTNENCMPVKDMVATITGKQTAEVTWNKYVEDQANDFRYILSTSELDAAGLAAATPLADTTAHLMLENLTSAETYYLYVTCACGENLSIWEMVSFTMPESCPAVGNVHVVDATYNVARIAWSRNQFGSESMWEASIVGDAASKQVVTDTTALFVGLDSETEYTVCVKAICSDQDTSAVAFVTFTTANNPSNCSTVGNGTSTSYSVPFDSYYKNAWVQMIYSADDINAAGTISAISFDMKAASSLGHTFDNLTIYMGHTSMSEAGTTSDWVAESDLVEVFNENNYSYPTEAGWLTIPLTNTFSYNGSDNLVVVTSHKAQEYSSTYTFAYTSGNTGVTMYRQSDTDPTCGDHPDQATGTRSTYLPNAEFCFVMDNSCFPVYNLEATDITTTSATVSWYPGSNEKAWKSVLSTSALNDSQLAAASAATDSSFTKQLTNLLVDQDYYFYVRPVCSATEMGEWAKIKFTTKATCVAPEAITVSDITGNSATVAFSCETPAAQYVVAYGPALTFNLANDSTFTEVTVADTTYTITGLESNSSYQVAVKALCSDTDNSRWSAATTFTTECGVISNFPWVEDFEGYMTGSFYNKCWRNIHITGAGTSVMSVSQNTEVANPTKVLYMADAQLGNSIMFSLPAMYFPGENSVEFTLDVKRTNYTSIKNNEGLHIYVSASDTLDGSEQLLAFVPREFTIPGNGVDAEPAAGWYTYSFVIPQQGERHIIIRGVSEYGAGTYFDNLMVSAYDSLCAGVDNLEVTNIAFTTATASWHALGNAEVNVVVLDPDDEEVFNATTSASSIQITGLVPGVKYTVKVGQTCGSRIAKTTFSTPHTVPFHEDFEDVTGWVTYYSTAASSYKWAISSNSSYVLGEMAGNVAYCPLYYYYNVASRLASPLIYIPEPEADKAVRLDWLMGATQYSTYSATALDPSTIVSVEIQEEGSETWTPAMTWSGNTLSEIPWGDASKFALDLSSYAGKGIKIGFLASIYDAETNAAVVIDSVNVQYVKRYSYDAAVCSSTDYQDEYFAIPLADFNVGETTQYSTLVSGQEGAIDTLVVLNLTVSAATETVVNDTICEGHLYDRNNITPFIAQTSVTRPMFLTSVNGCDSLVTVNITVIPAVKRDTTIYACKGSGVEVNGKMYYTTTVVADTLPGSNTCDSIVRTFIQFSETSGYNLEQHKVICKGDVYTDDAFPQGISAAGTYTGHVTTLYGCDSTVVLHISVAENGVAYDTIALSDLPYVYAEDTLLGKNVPVGDYQHVVSGTCGNVTLHITVVKGDGFDNIETLNLSVAPNPAVVGEPVKILSDLSFARDYSVTVYDALGQMVYTSDAQSLTIPGMPVAGFYTVSVTNNGTKYQAKLLVK